MASLWVQAPAEFAAILTFVPEDSHYNYAPPFMLPLPQGCVCYSRLKPTRYGQFLFFEL